MPEEVNEMPMISVRPKGWAPPKGYANGTIGEGRILCVGGQIGWTADKIFETDDFIGQMTQALLNVVAVVEAAAGRVEDIARLKWFVTDKEVYLANQRDVGAAYREVMGYHFPAMTMVVVSALVEDRALVEVEATAVLAAEAGTDV